MWKKIAKKVLFWALKRLYKYVANRKTKDGKVSKAEIYAVVDDARKYLTSIKKML